MKILHINCNYINSLLHSTMVSNLDNIGVKNKVFVPTFHDTVPDLALGKDVIISKCFKKWDRAIFYVKQNKIISAAEKALEINEFDALHAHTLFTDGNCVMRLSEKYHIPYIVAIRNTDVNTFFRLMPHLRNLGIRIMQNASAIVFLSPEYRNYLFDKYVPGQCKDQLAQKSYIIPNGIDDFWHENAWKKDINDSLERFRQKSIRVIYAGRVDRNKNIPSTQVALAILRSRGWKTELTVVGNIIDKIEYRRICNDPCTTYIPQQPKEKLLEYYRKNDVFVMPSHHETFGLVYAEAMSQGLPVVYTRGQGFDKQFPDGEVGLAIESKYPQTIANAIEAIVINYKTISNNCVQRVTNFKWDKIGKIYKSLYDEILTSKDENLSVEVNYK